MIKNDNSFKELIAQNNRNYARYSRVFKHLDAMYIRGSDWVPPVMESIEYKRVLNILKKMNVKSKRLQVHINRHLGYTSGIERAWNDKLDKEEVQQEKIRLISGGFCLDKNEE